MSRVGTVSMHTPQISAKRLRNGDWVKGPMSNFRYWAPLRSIATAAKIGEVLSDRVEYGDVIDQTLYQSADSYSQARLFYLQSRRNQLGYQFEGEDALFEELYGREQF